MKPQVVNRLLSIAAGLNISAEKRPKFIPESADEPTAAVVVGTEKDADKLRSAFADEALTPLRTEDVGGGVVLY